MSSTVNLMKGYMHGTTLGPGLYGGSGVKRITVSEMMGHEREKDGEEREKDEERREKGEPRNMGRRETTWQDRMGELSFGARVKKDRKGEGGQKSEQDPEGTRIIHEGDNPGPMTITIAEASSEVSDGSENGKFQSGDQKDGRIIKENRGNEAREDVESVD
ncbi:uncharacterized protein EAF01_003943 [Botrytis porri]|uniref:Uncharacterized protein n=1 Tax=Botrytis porri TaxID=87229 RepID=A0A4Z1KIH7_9HELO|nr:uncharacterized protein EAF01_003943 [Botrytis porri]KAF7908188.1 hypothetical protein EAF01_003943 [Botrytis porri]TGO85883.1 hypothetical protein BPOR_0355g00030 [Botrytis porri]